MFQKAPELKHMSMMYFVGCTEYNYYNIQYRCLDFCVNYYVDIYMHLLLLMNYRGNREFS